jgi:hypothetical protein
MVLSWGRSVGVLGISWAQGFRPQFYTRFSRSFSSAFSAATIPQFYLLKTLFTHLPQS